MDSPRTGGPLQPTLAASLTERGAPPLYRVGHDVWAPDGREQEAQYLASLTKAALLLGGVLQEEGRL